MATTTLWMTAQTPPREPARDAERLVLNVVYEGSEGLVRLNGIPLERFGKTGTQGDGATTLSIGLAEYGVSGVNTLVVEAKPARPARDASTDVALFVAGAGFKQRDSALQHPLFRQKIMGAGTVRHSVTLRNVPHHFFDDATPWHADPAALLTAVQALHKAFLKRDYKTIAASLRPVYDSSPNLRQLGGFDEMMRQLQQSLRSCTVTDLPKELKVETYYDGRLFRVTGENGAAPIRAFPAHIPAGGEPEALLEIGSFWCYRHGEWLPLGR